MDQPPDTFEHDGHWWDPENPDERWCGMLRFNEHEGGRLRLILTQDQSSRLRAQRDLPNPSVILGATTTGKRVTLLKCFMKSWNFNNPEPPCFIVFHANAVIQGFHCDSDDPLLDSVSLSLDCLTEWWGHSGIMEDDEVDFPDVVIRYASSKPILIYEDNGFCVKLHRGPAKSWSRHEISLRENVILEVGASPSRPLSEFEEISHACKDFLSIASMRCCSRTETGLRPPGDGALQHGTYHAVPIYPTREKSSFWLFRSSDVPDDGRRLLASWLSNADQLFYVRALYFAGVYGRGFIEQRLLFLTQAAEAFHRRFFEGSYMNEDEFKTEVLRPLTDAIPESTDRDFRQAIAKRLTYANEYSLRRRLLDLVGEHAAELAVLVRKPEKWVAAIVDLRNGFTHFPVADKKYSQPLGEQVLLYNLVLRLLLEACFLRTMGLDTKDAAACFANCSTYEQLSRKFVDAEP